MWNRLAPQPHVVDKILGELSRQWGVPAPHQAHQSRVSVPGRYVPTFGCKNQWELNQWKKILEPQEVPLKKPTHGLTFSDLVPLRSNTRVAAWKAPVVCREKLKCLLSRQAEAIVTCLNPPPIKLAGSWHIWDSINWANSDPPWRTSESLPQPTYGPP